MQQVQGALRWAICCDTYSQQGAVLRLFAVVYLSYVACARNYLVFDNLHPMAVFCKEQKCLTQKSACLAQEIHSTYRAQIQHKSS